MRSILRTLLFVVSIITTLFLWRCSSDDDEDTWQIIDDGIVGTWVLKSAEFRTAVDLDGPGPMLPTTDAKSIIYQIFDIYAHCSSIDDIPLQFTTEPPIGEGALYFYEGGLPYYSAKAICPQGQGVTGWIFDYTFVDNSGTSYPPLIYIQKETINDPIQLFDWSFNALKLDILSSDVIDGAYTISGELGEGSLISTLPEPKPDLTFDFVMERVDPN